ncbi:MAG: NTP transferase domain-containing protein [Alphaproteobacteria bacterium]|nr:NTP transferase domain-containing protein [Alphaproteobacteria bacterium]MBU1514780.1 NTP transferase domain-containing protein [Alphaproteobacteria bacterium]MBU2093911.1 NTP transferase domain-containing protein [Alphaproteobacteria bacterium]MBU2153338.1 NTP transferase domain-containing protein [Alphaproteobacteria bacterium]MBU2309766.1 NTP transferase domain-containing protein [Alphaproteobacteria bacterium]
MIVIPMAGRSQRFLNAGYGRPKHMLPLQGRSVFAHAVGSFEGEFGRTPFLIIAAADAVKFVRAECAAMGLDDLAVVALDRPTAGQAETVALGLDGAGVAADTPITIFNIDTFRPGFRFPGGIFDELDGWLEVFRGEGANWSYVKPAPGLEPIALETAEKRPISDLCCTGLYHFARAGDFAQALAAERAAPQAAELYVAPLYNHLIRQGSRIGYSLIGRDEVVFCGTPAEYEGLL